MPDLPLTHEFARLAAPVFPRETARLLVLLQAKAPIHRISDQVAVLNRRVAEAREMLGRPA